MFVSFLKTPRKKDLIFYVSFLVYKDRPNRKERFVYVSDDSLEHEVTEHIVITADPIWIYCVGHVTAVYTIFIQAVVVNWARELYPMLMRC